jgi:hypothetical protein
MVPQIQPDLTVKNILRFERHNRVTGAGQVEKLQGGKVSQNESIDWSENKHDVCFLNEKGEALLRLQLRLGVRAAFSGSFLASGFL